MLSGIRISILLADTVPEGDFIGHGVFVPQA